MSGPFLQIKDTSLLHISTWENLHPRLQVGFTTRKEGVSSTPFASFNFGFHVGDEQENVVRNRQLLARKISLPLTNWVSGEQTHQTNIKIVGGSDKGSGAATNQTALKQVDGLITNQKGVLCTAFFADCVPIFFFDPVTEYIGIAHAGWKGTVGRIAAKMVQKMTALGVDTTNLLVVIGPSISREKYEVDEQVIAHLSTRDRNKTVSSKGDSRYLLDLKQLNKEILLQSNVLRNNIDVTEYCTFRDQDLFFSHRRDQGMTGRMLGYIGFQE